MLNQGMRNGLMEQIMATQQNSTPANGGQSQQQQGSAPSPQQQAGSQVFRDWASI